MIKIDISDLQKLSAKYQVDFRIFGNDKLYFHSKNDEWMAEISNNKIVLKHIEKDKSKTRTHVQRVYGNLPLAYQYMFSHMHEHDRFVRFKVTNGNFKTKINKLFEQISSSES